MMTPLTCWYGIVVSFLFMLLGWKGIEYGDGSNHLLTAFSVVLTIAGFVGTVMLIGYWIGG